MAVRIVFLGKLADLSGEAEREVPAPLDWAQLLASLGPGLAQAVADGTVRIAVDGELLADKSMLSAQAGSEVALLPPVSGG
ncbi:MoaD/ThiS family protein [Aurantiacibacter sp. D1-12]|uniref:MoaD/ThiS family protein n=1 Tax=Aurantiacibacter sp. D1-12 TaxID=2993658 RepID=UPI00237C9B7F|nr:MoaD/ThiS family protein [Aurantiacibacter sp. D1-12]MDE1467866.1 MoaD/ThiS family protein [Aurantiacibacter sp. D1-12]